MEIKKLGPYTYRSILAHVSILVIIFILSYISKFMGSSQKKINIKLLESSVRVDLVAMPTLTVKELKKLTLAAPMQMDLSKVKKQKVIAAPQKNDFLKAKAKKKNFLDMMKKMSAKKIEHKVNNKKTKNKSRSKSNSVKKSTSHKMNRRDTKAISKLLLAGNKISKGSLVYGDGNGESETLFQEYALGLPDWVGPHWKLPRYLDELDLKCRIRIFIAGNGDLIKTELYESSGNDEFDQRAMKSIKLATPFQVPSKEIASLALTKGIILGFPL